MPARSESLRDALDAIDIETWLDQEGIRYRRSHGSRGRQANIQECPCCGNRKWKVYVGLETGLGNCFVCQQGFNKWTFILACVGGTASDAILHIQQVAREQGWRPPRPPDRASPPDLAPLALPASFALPHQRRNLNYLERRYISADIARYLGWRICVQGKFDYLDARGRARQQDYANRIIIPVRDLMGALVSFQGRDITGTAAQKYLFPPGFAVTGAHLYNGHNALGAERIAIGEGVFDVAAIKKVFDVDPALRDVVPVASFGKHLSHDSLDSQLAKLMLLKRHGLKQVTFLWDGEQAAIKAAVTAALRLRSVGLVARVALLPPGRDPNEVSPFELCTAFWQASVINDATATRLLLIADKYAARDNHP